MATVKSAEVGQSGTGTPHVSLSLETDEGKHITAYLYLSEKAFERTAKTLQEVFGFDGDFQTVSDQVLQKKCSITVEEEDDQDGKPRMRVKWINSPRMSKPVEESFLAKLTRKARELGIRPAPKTPSVAPAGDEDEIPF